MARNPSQTRKVPTLIAVWRTVSLKSLAILALFVLLTAVYYFAIRPGQLRWGATPEELARPLPGDDLVPAPTFCATRAVTITGRPEDIWPWIVQIGYDRAGFYGYDLIENLGSKRGIRSARKIAPELQHLAVGDRVDMSRIAYLVIHSMAPNQFLIWTGAEDPPGGAFTWALFPVDKKHTRLVMRIRFQHHWTDQRILLDLFTEFADHVAVPKMLLGIRDRVESRRIQPLTVQAAEITVWIAAFLEFVVAVVLILVRRQWWAAWATALLAAAALLFVLYAREPIGTGALLELPIVAAIARAWRADRRGSMSMFARFSKEVASTEMPAVPVATEVVTSAQLASLPEPAQRYLRFMGVVGRSQDWSFRLGFTGRFRTKPQQPWMKCEAWQYNNRLAVARIFHIRIRFGGLLPVLARDTYVHGRGRMRVRLLDLFTIEDGTGEEYDTGELVTYLNDAVLIGPSMLLVPEISWAPADASSFDVSLTDHGRTVTARVIVDETGAPRDFSTTDRFCYNPDEPKKLVRARWSTPIAGWEIVDGRPRPTGGQAVWHLPRGPFAYADFHLIPGSLVFNVQPGARAVRNGAPQHVSGHRAPSSAPW